MWLEAILEYVSMLRSYGVRAGGRRTRAGAYGKYFVAAHACGRRSPGDPGYRSNLFPQ